MDLSSKKTLGTRASAQGSDFAGYVAKYYVAKYYGDKYYVANSNLATDQNGPWPEEGEEGEEVQASPVPHSWEPAAHFPASTRIHYIQYCRNTVLLQCNMLQTVLTSRHPQKRKKYTLKAVLP